MLMFNNKNTATDTMTNDYVASHIRGEEVLKAHPETGLLCQQFKPKPSTDTVCRCLGAELTPGAFSRAQDRRLTARRR